VPVHPELLKIGFLDHVTEAKRRGDDRLFPELKPGGADNKVGFYFTKWWSRYRKDIKLYRLGLDFHAFRHTAVTTLQEAGVTGAMIGELVGHAGAGETARYTKPLRLRFLAEAIGKLDLEVDLARLGENRGTAA
jgi:integrase